MSRWIKWIKTLCSIILFSHAFRLLSHSTTAPPAFGLLASAVVQSRSSIKQSALLLDAKLTALLAYLLYGNFSSEILDVKPTTNTCNWNSRWPRNQSKTNLMPQHKTLLVQYMAPANNNVAQAWFAFFSCWNTYSIWSDLWNHHFSAEAAASSLPREYLLGGAGSNFLQGPRYTDMLNLPAASFAAARGIQQCPLSHQQHLKCACKRRLRGHKYCTYGNDFISHKSGRIVEFSLMSATLSPQEIKLRRFRWMDVMQSRKNGIGIIQVWLSAFCLARDVW